jgi:hypothetical protein
MRIEEISEGYRNEYEMICDLCEMKQLILTQRNSFPEYETEIYLQCVCGNFVQFILPVN